MKVLGNLTLEDIVVSMVQSPALPSARDEMYAAAGEFHLRVELGLKRLNDLFPILMRCQTTSGGAADGMSRIELDIEWVKRMAAGAN